MSQCTVVMTANGYMQNRKHAFLQKKETFGHWGKKKKRFYLKKLKAHGKKKRQRKQNIIIETKYRN